MQRSQILRRRAEILKATRSFFEKEGFLHIETPLLVPSPGMESNLYAFKTIYHAQDGRRREVFLPTSPEFHLKRILSEEFANVYEITRAFRDRESSRLHSPEFSILEWYRAHAGYEQIMTDMENLLFYIAQSVFRTTRFQFQGKDVSLVPPFAKMTVKECWKTWTGIDLDQNLDRTNLRKAGEKIGVKNLTPEDDWEVVYFKIFLDRIEPLLGIGKPLILYEYPASMAALSRIKPEDPSVALRFELYINGLELANAFDELTDADEQLARMVQSRKIQIQNGDEPFPIDQGFLHALKKGIPPSAGVALGLDRLIMVFLNCSSISEVIAFPFSPKSEDCG